MSLGLMVLYVIANVAIFFSRPVLPGYHSLKRFRRLLGKNFTLDPTSKKEKKKEIRDRKSIVIKIREIVINSRW